VSFHGHHGVATADLRQREAIYPGLTAVPVNVGGGTGTVVGGVTIT